MPPQILVQMLYGEAHGQAAVGDTVSELAIGATVRNRFGDTAFPNTPTTYQDAIILNQFAGIDTSINTGTAPELNNAALIFGGVTTAATKVANAKCFFTPDANGWAAIRSELGNASFTVVPDVKGDPGCFSSRDPNGQLRRENEQFVYKLSVGDNSDGRGAPAFIFVQWKKSSDSAVIKSLE